MIARLVRLARPVGINSKLGLRAAKEYQCADALISPLVGGNLWMATAGMTAHSARKIQGDKDDRKILVWA